MKTIYSIRVAIPAATISLEETFCFEDPKDRAMFADWLTSKITGAKILKCEEKYLFTPAEAVEKAKQVSKSFPFIFD